MKYAYGFLGLGFPEEIGGAVAGAAYDLESSNPGAGYGVEYDLGPDWRIQVYIYDFGLASIPADPQLGPTIDQLQISVREIFAKEADGTLRHVDLVDTYTFGGDEAQCRFVCSRFAIDVNDKDQTECLTCLTSWRNKFIKLRITVRQSETAHADAQAFVRAWENELWPSD